MDWDFIIHHLFSGCIPMLAMLILYYLILYLIKAKRTVAHTIVSFAFCFYLIGIFTATGICLKGSFSPRIMLIPFVDMVRGPTDTILNILLFVPMGFFLPMLYENYSSIRKVAIAGFLVSLTIEIVQMFGFGATDINDLITNTIGTCLGFSIYQPLRRALPKSWIQQLQVVGIRCYTEPLLFWFGSLLIMLTFQVYIFHAVFSANIPTGDLHLWK